VLERARRRDPLLDIAKGLEEVALSDDYFVERKLYPNVDFYSGIIYRAMGIPTDMFTVMFALGRLPGWIAHWKEMRRRASAPASQSGSGSGWKRERCSRGRRKRSFIGRVAGSAARPLARDPYAPDRPGRAGGSTAGRQPRGR
jgi:hypothetical protein